MRGGGRRFAETLGVTRCFPGAARFGSPDGVGGKERSRGSASPSATKVEVVSHDTEFERRASFDSPPRDAKPRPCPCGRIAVGRPWRRST